MRRNVTYPKNGERRLRETIKDLKAELRQSRKREELLRRELENIVKPERPRKEHVEEKSQKLMTQDEWRKDFIDRFRPAGLDRRLKEIDGEKEDNGEEKD